MQNDNIIFLNKFKTTKLLGCNVVRVTIMDWFFFKSLLQIFWSKHYGKFLIDHYYNTIYKEVRTQSSSCRVWWFCGPIWGCVNRELHVICSRIHCRLIITSNQISFCSQDAFSFVLWKGIFTDHRLFPFPMTRVCIRRLFDTGSQPFPLHRRPKQSFSYLDPKKDSESFLGFISIVKLVKILLGNMAAMLHTLVRLLSP